MNIAGITFDNNKGALIVGKNSTGKSTILSSIAKESPKSGANKGKIDVDGIPKDLIFIESETFLKSSFDGSKSFWVENNKRILSETENTIAKPAAITPIITTYVGAINAELASAHNITNINGTGIDVKYEATAKESIIDLKTSITFDGQTFDLSKASSGIKTIIALSLKSISGSLTDKVIMIDEPEVFLHPEWISLICKLISSLVSNNIVIATSHNALFTSSFIKENPDMLSTVSFNATPPGDVNTWDYNNLKTGVMNLLNAKPTYFGHAVGTKSLDFADRYIRFVINESSAMMFFWEKPLFVEGQTEKAYLEQKYGVHTISAGGFHDYLIYKAISDELGIESKFLMDTDHGLSAAFNNYTFTNLGTNVLRLAGNFDDFLGGSPARYEKIMNALDKIPSTPADPSGELTAIETFIS